MKENTNEMILVFDSIPVNEGLARVTAASFCTQLNPTLEEVADLKTAVSEAVTNCIIHGYEGKINKIEMKLQYHGNELYVHITDYGIGITDIEKAMEPMYTSKPDHERSGMGFTFMEAFMDEIRVESQPGQGTTVHMKKTIGRKREMPEDTLALIGRAHQGDKEARERLFHENTGLIYCAAKRFLGRGVDMEDLFQIGSIGLLKAVDKFDTSYDVKFSTYAVPMIIGEIKRFLRDDGILKVSRSVKENQYRIGRKREELEKALGREPTLGELAESVQMLPEELAMTMDAANDVESIYQIIYQGEGNELRLLDKIPEKENLHDRLLNKIFLEELLRSLNAEERKLLYMRYFREMTQTEVADEFGVSQVQISRMEKKILNRLRAII